jgi:hypothetical protein
VHAKCLQRCMLACLEQCLQCAVRAFKHEEQARERRTTPSTCLTVVISSVCLLNNPSSHILMLVCCNLCTHRNRTVHPKHSLYLCIQVLRPTMLYTTLVYAPYLNQTSGCTRTMRTICWLSVACRSTYKYYVRCKCIP